ncbi:MAG: helix-turn-helix domain-containing protein [Spirochaetales bacterium]|uniref:Helix-turn-helix domain-containing protein n=1 Tax=Candidatus Thalassospirochaeta sargassi TaxID=3119039 RepID=A0AAJ1I9I1_9SPIO|nr:helix-turn-helix domain-containing protein [Spirochaetales bacterium]
MKDRQKKILRFMLLTEGMLHIEDIAEVFSVGKRTVSRDLDTIEQWLSFRDAGLERKPNQGIRVMTFGRTADELLDIVNTPNNYLESLDAEHRQRLILLYLLFSNCEVKISSIANVFYISDTSVWSDLNQIENRLEGSKLRIERMKGVGIRLSGPESVMRLGFLSVLTEAYSSHTIIPYLYAVREDRGSFLEINQLKFLMNRLNFSENSTEIFNTIAELQNELGYQFTMSSESLLYFYLQLSIHRIKSKALINETGAFGCSPFFAGLGERVLDKLTAGLLDGRLPDSEYCFLGLLMQILEPGDINRINTEELFGGMITEDIVSFTSELISEFGRIDSRQYYLNDQIESKMQIISASLVKRLENGIPFWHGEWGETTEETWNRSVKAGVLSELLKRYFGLEPDPRDIDYILLYFHSMVFNEKDLPDKKVRCLVCCFEGIGLASYLSSILTREISSINIVEATAVFRIKQEYLDANGIELVISTFPIAELDIPVIPVSLPLNREMVVRQIEKAVGDLKTREASVYSESKNLLVENNTGRLSLSNIISFINDFSLVRFSSSNSIDAIIDQLPTRLDEFVTDRSLLSEDFRKREALGPLIVEEWGLKILHCKSTAAVKPVAGVIAFDDETAVRMLYLISPDPCPDLERKMLSTITVSFLENRDFRKSILTGGIEDMKKELLNIYQS